MTPLEETGRFATVVIDPPWPIRLGQTIYKPGHSNPGISAQSGGHWDNRLDYKTLDLDGIAAIPVPSVLADDAWLFCWTVNQFIPQTYAILESWGCHYSFTMTWIKNKGPQFPASPASTLSGALLGGKDPHRLWTASSSAPGTTGNVLKKTVHTARSPRDSTTSSAESQRRQDWTYSAAAASPASSPGETKHRTKTHYQTITSNR